MKPTDDLYRLIRSLTRNEKAYFARRTKALSGDNVAYLKLFKVLEGMKEYNEKEAKRKVKSLIPPARFAFYKNYLFSEILDTLNQFHSDRSVRSRIFRMYRNYELLSERGFNERAYQTLQKALELAVKYDLSELQLEIHREILLNFPRFIRPEPQSISELNKHVENCSKLLHKMTKGYHIHPIRIAIYFQLRDKGTHTARLDKEWILKWESAMMEWDSVDRSEVSFEHMALLWWIRSVWHSMNGDLEKAFQASENRRALFNAESHQVDEHLERYLGSLTEQISIASNLGKQEEFEKLVAELEGMVENKDAILRSEYHYLRYRMILIEVRMARAYALRQFHQFPLLYHAVIKDRIIERALGFTEHGSAYLHYQVLNLSFYLSSYLITGAHYREAIRVINLFPRDLANDRAEYTFYIEILKLIAHHELRHWEVVARESKKVIKTLEDRKVELPYESWFINILIESAQASSESERKKIFLHASEQAKSKRESFTPAFGFFDCREYIQGKSEDKAMVDLLSGIK